MNLFSKTHNVSVIPIGKKSKKPLVEWKIYQTRRPNIEEIQSWKEQWPDCNWAMVTGNVSGVVVVDCDSQEDYEFVKSRGLPHSPTVKTARGFHVYFQYQEGVRGLQSVSGRKDIQLKAEGGYVLIPPSIHPSGATYQWLDGASLDDLPLAGLPDWVLEEAKENTEVSLAELYKGVTEGGRNGALARLVGSWANDSVALADAVSYALSWNERNVPPLPADEVQRTVESIYRGHFERHPEKDFQDEITPPEEINDFLKRDIPPVEFLVDQIVQRNGRTMISAAPNKGKSLLSQNIALAVTSTMGALLHQFAVKRVKTLYLDFEMGESPVHERFKKMLAEEFLSAKDLFIKCLLGKDILDESFKKTLEEWLQSLEVGLLIIDPIGSAWCGDENNKEEVSKLTSYLDSLIDRFKITIVFVHHWRKASQHQKTGSEMAAGSYKFNAWVDVHITLDGESSCVTLTCQKARTAAKFPPIRIKLNPATMMFEYLGKIEVKYNEETLAAIYQGMNREWVTIPELIKECAEKGSAGKDTVRRLLRNPKRFEIDKEGKAHRIRLQPGIVLSCEKGEAHDL